MPTKHFRLSSLCLAVFVYSTVAAQQAKLMLPIGHRLAVLSATFSPDGKKVVTASFDNTAKIWDASTGNLLADLKGHEEMVTAAAFSPDGKKIVTVSYDKTIKVWDAATNALITTFKGHKDVITGVWFSPDGRKIITVSKDKTAKIWDLLTIRLVADLKDHTDWVLSAQFSPDGSKVITGSADGTAIVWNVFTAQKLWDTKNTDGHKGSVTAVAFSPDNKYVVTASDDKTARLWTAETGKIFLVLQREHTAKINDVAFSPDSKMVVTASNDRSAVIWNFIDKTAPLHLTGHTGKVNTALFSPDGKWVLTSSKDGTARTWNAQTGKPENIFSGHKGEVLSAVFNKDGSLVTTASVDATAKIWNTGTGKLVTDLKSHASWFYSAQYSPDGKNIITASDDPVAKIWDATTIKLTSEISGHKGPVKVAAYSPDNKLIVTSSDDSTVKIWDAASHTLIRTIAKQSAGIKYASFNPAMTKLIIPETDTISKVWDIRKGLPDSNLINTHKWFLSHARFSPDSQYIVGVPDDTTVRVFDKNGNPLFSLRGHDNNAFEAEFSPDSKRIISAGGDHTAIVWDVNTRKAVYTLYGHTGYIRAIGFSPDSKKIVTGSDDNLVKLWDATTGNLIADLKGHTDWVSSAQFSPDGKRILTSSGDNTIKVWDVQTARNLYTFFPVDSNDYLVVDSLSHYDGTEAARKLLYFTCGNEIVSLDQVKDQLWVPNLAERLNKGETINARSLDELNICGLTPETKDISSGNEDYRFKITPRRGGLGETVVSINGTPTRTYQKGELIQNNGTYELVLKKEELLPFFIPGKENSITIKAFTADNSIASRGGKVETTVSKDSAAPPNLYGVMVGVSDYKGNELDLRYAAKDANDLSNALAISARKMLNTDSKDHVFMYNLTTADGHYQLPEKNAIHKLLQEIGQKATANDILFIFFAGHGVMKKEKGQFYFLTADATNAADETMFDSVGISMNELTEWMKPQVMKAQKRILVFDACNSGQAIKDFVKMGDADQHFIAARGDDNSQQIKAIDKLNEKSGLFIFSAATSDQSAYEMGRVEQGLLTYSLLKAIKEEPGILVDGNYLDISRWFDAAGKTVVEIVKETGNRQEPQIVSNTNFNIGLVDAEVMSKIKLPDEKPLIVASAFQNTDTAVGYDNLGVSKIFNARLAQIASKDKDSKIVYVPASSSPDAWIISGGYTISGESILVRATVIQGAKHLSRMDKSGPKDKLKEMINEMAEKIVEDIVKKSGG